MADIIQRFSGNPFTSVVGQKIEHATDASLTSENWALIMEICDLINETEEGARDAVRAIKKRLQQNAGKNHTVIMLTLTVLEAAVKNCGKRFHVLVTNKDFVQDLVKIIGPKNDPPTAVQEKVLSLIQSWADAFRGQTECQGVVQVYHELRSKGIEFPMTDLDSMAPIHTPQRSVSTSSAPQRPSSASPVPHAAPPAAGQVRQQQLPKRIQLQGPIQLNPEQMTKLKSELDIVQGNAKVLDEMLNELVPGAEHYDDEELLTQLYSTCQAMQARIVELLDKVANEEVTCELLRINDELNNLFVRYERHVKKSQPNGVPTQSLTSKTPTTTAEEPQLIDFDGDAGNNAATASATTRLANMSLASGTRPAAQAGASGGDGDADFDMFAATRGSTFDQMKNNSTSYSANREPQTNASLASLAQAKAKRDTTTEPPVEGRDSDFDEMERWLQDQPVANQGSSEFDRFLAERANAVQSQPSPNRQVPKKSDDHDQLFGL